MRLLPFFASVLAAALAAPSSAEKIDTGVVALQAPPSALRPDAAYLLLRTSTAKSGLFPIQHVLLRIPSETDVKEQQTTGKGRANTFVVESGKFLEDGEMRTVLLEVPPGTYVLYGTTVGSRGLVTCNCLGTVKFAARAGVITDMGSLYADKVHKESPIPHLEDRLGPKMFQYGWILGEGLVPSDASTKVPASLAAFTVEPARFEATPPFYQPAASTINRLAPVPGILGYKHGRPVDLRTGELAK